MPSAAQNSAGRDPESAKRASRSTQSCRVPVRERDEGRASDGATAGSDMSRDLQRFGRPLQGNQPAKDVIRRARTLKTKPGVGFDPHARFAFTLHQSSLTATIFRPARTTRPSLTLIYAFGSVSFCRSGPTLTAPS